ncbi:MAG: FKBP-type peptidyl-prolyl cis-trans isomerase [Treponema sp.]|nr:FKBP-type peptidyl-prolyl cis-trans isomerase [Treponema sp.]
MKKTAIFLCFVLSLTALHARAIQEDYKTAEEKTRTSYAFGMIIARNFDLGSLNVDFDYSALAEGIKDYINDTSDVHFSEQEAMEIVETALQRAWDRSSQENRALGEAFLASNSQRQGVHVTASGLQYEIINQTTGEKPTINSEVRVNYTGTYIDGRIFESSRDEAGTNIPMEFLIEGLSEGIMLMSPGSIYRFFIPSNLAYGREGLHGVPPNSTVIFSIELLEIINEN